MSRTRAILACAAFLLLVHPLPAAAQSIAPEGMPAPDPADVGTIRGMIHAWYDVINGPAGAPRQWRRDSTLYTAGATFVAVKIKGGKKTSSIRTPEEFRKASNAYLVASGFYETEIGSRIERFGDVASVRSVYESRNTAAGPVIARGINYIHLFWDGNRWWITGAVWQEEDQGVKIPASWVGAHSVAP
jgi:hypothetical protein